MPFWLLHTMRHCLSVHTLHISRWSFAKDFFGNLVDSFLDLREISGPVEALLLSHLEVNLVAHFSMWSFTFSLRLGMISTASDYFYAPPLKKSVHFSFELGASVTLKHLWTSMLSKNPSQIVCNIGTRFSCNWAQQKKAWEIVNDRQNVSLRLSFM